MSVIVRIDKVFDQPVCNVNVAGEKAFTAFKNLVRRGLRDQDPPELKELYDLLEHGRVLQDYRSQGFKRGELDTF
jgi:hypothetical protein